MVIDVPFDPNAARWLAILKEDGQKVEFINVPHGDMVHSVLLACTFWVEKDGALIISTKQGEERWLNSGIIPMPSEYTIISARPHLSTHPRLNHMVRRTAFQRTGLPVP